MLAVVVVATSIAVVREVTGRDPDSDRAGAAEPECLVETYLPCIRQAVALVIPISGSPASLAYSSDHHRMADGSSASEAWLQATDLGGWTLDVVHRLDVDAGILHLGGGASRSVDPIELSEGEHRGRLAVAAGDGDVYLFDRDGTHVETVSALDGTTVLAVRYDKTGKLAEVRGADGRGVAISRDDREVSLVSASGRRTNVELDQSGGLARVTDPVGAVWNVDVDRDGLVSRIENPDGHPYQYTYGDDGRLIEARDPADVVTNWDRTATEDGYTVVRTESSGESSSWTLDGSADEYTATSTGADGLTTREEGARDRYSVDWPDGTTLDVRLEPDPRWEWQAAVVGQATMAVDAGSDVVTTSTVEVTEGDDLLSPQSIRESWTYGEDTYSQIWDRSSRQLIVTTPEGREERVHLDESGRPVSQSVAGVEQRATYGERGQLTTLDWGEAGPRFSFEYEANGVRATGPGGSSQHVEVDRAGRTTRTQISDDSYAEATWLDSGALESVSVDGDRIGELTYAADGRPASFILGGQPIRRWNYDPHGRMTGYVDGSDRAVALTYDEASRVTQMDSDADSLRFGWDEATGDLVSIDGESVQLTHDYMGSVLATEEWSGAVSGSVQRELDDDLRVNAFTVGDVRLPISYDGDDLIAGVGPAEIERGPAGEIVLIEQGDLVEQRSYDDLGLLSEIDVQAGATSLYRLAVTRDQLGRVIERTETHAGAPPTTTSMSYDSRGQLTEVAVGGTVTEQYSYDELGNRIRTDGSGHALDVRYDDAGRVISEGGASYTFDDAGRLASRQDETGTTHLDYDALGLLREVREEGGRIVRYEHDGTGRRVASTIDAEPGTGLLYLDGQRPAARVSADGVDAAFGYADDDLAPVTMTTGEESYRIIADDTGSPRLVVDTQTGEVVQRLDYSAFGQVVNDTSPGFQPFAFGGGIVDPVSGLVRFGARDYDPSSGRWTAPDPILFEGGDVHLYRYAFNDPVNLRDPSGLSIKSFICDVIFVVMNALAGQDCGNVGGSRQAPETGRVEAEKPNSLRRPTPNDPTPGPDPHARRTPRRAPRTSFDPPNPRRPTAPNTAPNRLRNRLPRDFRPPSSFGTRGSVARGALPGLAGLAATAWAAFEWYSYLADWAEAIGDFINQLGEDLDPESGEEALQLYCRQHPFHQACADQPLGPPIELPEGRPNGGVRTDPHLETIDGLRYEFQAVGEYTVVRGEDLEVQARFTNVENGEASFTVAVAAQLPGSDQAISVYAEDIGPDGWAVAIGDERFLVAQGQSRLGDYVLNLEDRHLRIETDGGMGLDINAFEWSVVAGFSFRFDLDPSLAASVAGGLIGDVDGDQSNDHRLPDGEVIPIEEFDFDTKYETFGEAWRVKTIEESLFVYGPGEDPSTFHNPQFPREEVSLANFTQDELLRGLQPCLEANVWMEPALSACVFDVAATQDIMWVQTGTRFQETLPDQAAALALPNGLFGEHGGYTLWEHEDFDIRAFIGSDATRPEQLIVRGLEVEVDGSTTLIFPGWEDPPPSIDLPGDRELRLSSWREFGVVATLDGSMDGVSGLATEELTEPSAAGGPEGDPAAERHIPTEAAQEWAVRFPAEDG